MDIPPKKNSLSFKKGLFFVYLPAPLCIVVRKNRTMPIKLPVMARTVKEIMAAPSHAEELLVRQDAEWLQQ